MIFKLLSKYYFLNYSKYLYHQTPVYLLTDLFISYFYNFIRFLFTSISPQILNRRHQHQHHSPTRRDRIQVFATIVCNYYWKKKCLARSVIYHWLSPRKIYDDWYKVDTEKHEQMAISDDIYFRADYTIGNTQVQLLLLNWLYGRNSCFISKTQTVEEIDVFLNKIRLKIFNIICVLPYA